MAERQVDVAVVGGGLSGLFAARQLLRAGQRVVVLEANPRVGGRVLRQEAGGALFDVGGQWLGPQQKRMMALVAELGLATYPTYHSGYKLTEVGGQLKRHRTTIPPLGLHNLLLIQRAIWAMNRRMRQVFTAAPWSTKLAATWDGETLETFKQRLLPFANARGAFDAAVRVIFGCEASEISLLYFLSYLRGGGGFESLIEIENGAQQTRVVGGTQLVALRLADSLGDAVVLSSPVSAIEVVAASSHPVVVHSSSGSYRARRVVLALAPSMAARIDFTPALSRQRQQLMQRSMMGATVKCIAVYQSPFWRAAGLSGEAVCSGGPHRCGGPASVIFDNCIPDGPAALLGFVVGQAGREWGDRDAAERRQAFVDQLGRYFGPAARRPLHYLEKDWADERYIGGCPVANLPPGALTQLGPTLRTAIGPLHWAGTETATDWAGYMEGAIQAAERVAAEILASSG